MLSRKREERDSIPALRTISSLAVDPLPPRFFLPFHWRWVRLVGRLAAIAIYHPEPCFEHVRR